MMKTCGIFLKKRESASSRGIFKIWIVEIPLRNVGETLAIVIRCRSEITQRDNEHVEKTQSRGKRAKLDYLRLRKYYLHLPVPDS